MRWLALLPGLLAALLPGMAMACPLAPLQQAAGAGDLRAVLAAQRDIEAAGALCEAEQRAWAGRLVATLHGAEAERMLRAGARPAAALEVVDRGLAHGRPWRTLRLRGEIIARNRGPNGVVDWAEASLAMQDALNDTLDQAEEPRANQAELEALVNAAAQFRMNADRILRARPMRDGSPGGLERNWNRGIRIVAVAQPIHFIRGEAAFTALGRQAAAAMAEMLEREGRPRIRLVGHTDPDGSDEYNLRLSFARADAVREFLEARGYPRERIAIEGRGKRDPIPPAIDGAFTREEYFQVLRRVMLERREP
jgi:outer membrane protein OmpA-like peptidoglycan-associated protein